MDWLTSVNHTHWLALGLILLIAELATGTTYLLWPAVAAGLTGLLSLFMPMGFLTELAIFAVLTIALTAIGRPLVRNRLLAKAGSPTLNERGQALVGVRGIAAGAFMNGVGSVKVGDTIWRATSADEIAAGQAVEVIGVDGATIAVKGVA